MIISCTGNISWDCRLNKESIAPVRNSFKVLFYYFFSPTTSSAINPIIGLITNERRNQPMKDRLFPEARKPISIQKATQRSTIMMTSYFFTFIRRCYWLFKYPAFSRSFLTSARSAKKASSRVLFKNFRARIASFSLAYIPLALLFASMIARSITAMASFWYCLVIEDIIAVPFWAVQFHDDPFQALGKTLGNYMYENVYT